MLKIKDFTKEVGEMTNQEKWDLRFLALARHIAQWSKDPSTKTGAVLVRQDKTIAALGYNGFPRNIADKTELLDNRAEKYKRVVHCEMNAILSLREPATGMTLYTWPFMSCERCAVHVLQAGITRVVFPSATQDAKTRWADSFAVSLSLFQEAGVEIEEYDIALLQLME
jgi:dCMP deaminase